MISYLKTFFLTLTDLSVYPKLVVNPLTRALRYVFLFYLILALILGTYHHFFTLPQIFTTATQILTDFSRLPEAASLSVNPDGTPVFTGLDLPYNLSLSQTLGEFTQLVVIDPSRIAEDIKPLRTVFLLTAKNLVFASALNRNNLLILPWSVLGPNLKLEGSQLIREANILLNLIQQSQPYRYPLLVVIQYLSLILARLSFLGLNILFIYLIGRLFGRVLSFKSYLKIGLHTLVLTELIWQLAGLVYRPLNPGFFSLAFYLTTTLALSQTLPTKPSAKIPPA